MNSKGKFTVGILVLTVLFIGFLSLVFIMGMFLAMEEFSPERLGLLIISLGLAIITIRKMIEMNRNEVTSRVDAVVNKKHEFICEWTIDVTEWKRFRQEELAEAIKESNSFGLITGLIFGVIVGFVAYSSISIEIAVVSAVVTFCLFFLVGKFGSIGVAKRKFRKYTEAGIGEIHFAKEVIIINGQLVTLDGFGQRLKSFKKEPKFGISAFAFSVETGFGNRKNINDFLIPIPDTKEEEADKLLKYYSGLVG